MKRPSRPHVISKVLRLLPSSLPPPKSFKPPKALFLGEGDFSFTSTLHSNLLSHSVPTRWVCTSYEPAAAVLSKYKEKASSSLSYLREAEGCEVLHGVDAMNLDKCQPLEGEKFDLIIFMFPHSGTQRTHVNRELISRYFSTSLSLASPTCVVWVATTDCQPYNSWRIPESAKGHGYEEVKDWRWSLREEGLKGYEHVTTLGEEAYGGKGGAML
ncbi:hypothetical protein TrRE_jg6207 [Triparma retinervis]|uniref:25S rRNA (uridine-N(3))-methyltransferase BMT5-like domain-containing protein n=1 Tax=Triparma retinervis TaxID=2557542 RepID=A0A9W7F5T0_9STRA|nr:hypothetical protein TrRE_jg6207 [Triparma retinervis]